MSKAMDYALDIRAGQKTIKDVPPRIQAKVAAALANRPALREYAGERERAMMPQRSRFHATGVTRARFT